MGRGARAWYDLWAKTEPDSPAFERWRRTFEPLDAPLLARMVAALADFD